MPACVSHARQTLPLLTVVEEPAVPHPVVAPRSTVEVHAISAIKHVDAVVRVLTGMTVNNVHQHNETHAVSLINQGLQLLWGTTATGHLQTSARNSNSEEDASSCVGVC